MARSTVSSGVGGLPPGKPVSLVWKGISSGPHGSPLKPNANGSPPTVCDTGLSTLPNGLEPWRFPYPPSERPGDGLVGDLRGIGPAGFASERAPSRNAESPAAPRTSRRVVLPRVFLRSL